MNEKKSIINNQVAELGAGFVCTLIKLADKNGEDREVVVKAGFLSTFLAAENLDFEHFEI